MITLYNEEGIVIARTSDYEFIESDMGESSITATVLLSGVQDFHPDWYVEYNGEKFRLGVRKPTGKKDTSSKKTSYTLVFKSEREDLKRYTFMDFVELGSGNPQPGTAKVPLYATLTEFVDRFNLNLQYYLGTRCRMVLPESYVESGNSFSVTFENASLWDVLIQVYEIFGVRWTIQANGEELDIIVGADAVEIEHIFEYGKDNGLVSVERNNELERIITRLRGVGSTKNLPADYLHDGDPDTNSVLQSVYFQNLLPSVYRDYVRGYNAGSGTGSWAYNQGVADKQAGKPMSPIDYTKSDNEELWGVSYGAIEANEEIYPTLQGVEKDGIGRVDEVVAVEPVRVDSPEDSTEGPDYRMQGASGSVAARDGSLDTSGIQNCRGESNAVEKYIEATLRITQPYNKCSLLVDVNTNYIPYNSFSPETADSSGAFVVKGTLELFSKSNGRKVASQDCGSSSGSLALTDLPAGEYRLRYSIKIYAKEDKSPTNNVCNVGYILSGTYTEYTSLGQREGFKETFDIWIKDVWGIARNADESDEDYTYRVWSPLAVSDEMTVMFSDGMLAGEDYEFRIVGASSDSDDLRQVIVNAIHPDTSKSHNGVSSAWRLSVEKSDAELQASGRYLPNSMVHAKAGDHFFFINIKMPYDPYVFEAEERLTAYLDEQLALKDVEYPSFTISPSSIFCKNFAEASKIRAGAKIRVRNAELIGSSYTTLHIQSLTKRYTSGSVNPEWSVTVSDEVVASGNPIETLSGEVDVLNAQVYSNRQAISEAIRQLQSTFLRKDGISDKSYSPTEFSETVRISDKGIRDAGFVNGELSGKGFAVYTDGDGNRVVEADVIIGRVGARFNEVVINQTTYTGGKQVFSAAGMVVSAVEQIDGGWRCYFDTKNGTVRNMFKVGDGAFCQRFTDAGPLTYWRRVTAIGSDYIDISSTDALAGSAEPGVGDNIAQLGNDTDTSRQAAFMIDEVRDGGGLVTWYDDISGYTLESKDSVMIGRIDGKTWLKVYGSGYIGTRDESQYVKFENGILSIKGAINAESTVGDLGNIGDILSGVTGLEYLKEALPQNTTISGGLILSSTIALGYKDGDTYKVMSGMSGLYDAEQPGGGIAAWYGGDKAEGVAKSLFRFDGTGYLADGKISWDDAGNVILDKKIKIGDEETLSSILTVLNNINNDYLSKSRGGTVQGDTIFAGKLYIPSTLGAGRFYISVSDNPVSGESPSGSSGMDTAALWEELGGNATDKIIGLSRIPDIPVDMVSGLLGGDSRILPSLLPDWLMGQLLYGGTVDGSSVATVSAAFKDRYGTGGDTVTLSASNASQYEGVYFIASADASSGVVQSLGVRTGDWVVSNGIEWTKIDNTDSVSSVAGLTGVIGKAALQTALSDSTHRFVTDAQIASWDGKWAWNADDIKAVKVNAAVLADKAKALNAARSLWGQSFDGTGDVDGDMSGVGGITMSGSIAGAVNADFSGYLSAGTLYVPYSGGSKVYSLKVSDAPVSGESPSGSSGMDTDALWLELGGSTDDKVIAKSHLPEDTVYEGDLAGYALKSEIPSLAGYATQSWVQSQGYLKSVSLATISDLHSSWDAVLKAQKPAWLTAVSLATISDLHSSWDALLKAQKPTTLAGYGITNAYTQTEVNAKLDAYLPLAGGTMSGAIRYVSNGNRYLTLSKAGLHWDFSDVTGGHSKSWLYVTEPDGSSYVGMGVYGEADGLNYFYIGGTYTAPWITLRPSGNVGIGTASPSYKLHVGGNAYATGDMISSSFSLNGSSGVFTFNSSTDSTWLQGKANKNFTICGLSDTTLPRLSLKASDTYATGDFRVGGSLFIPSTSGNKVYSLKVSDSPVSGESPSAGGGGLDVDAMWDELEASDASRVIDASHIPLLDMEKVSGLPTALSVVNASLNAMSEALQDKADISDIPSLSGYVSSVTTSGTGNAVTGFSKSGNTLTLVKGTTFLTSVPAATTSAYGGIRVGYSESGKNYPVELDSSGRAYVSVPWVNTTYSLSSFGITATAAEINKLDGIGTLLHSGNIGSYALTPSNYASTLDSRYVNVSGDTMTGPLTITTSSDDILVFNDTASEKYFRIKAMANGTDWGGLVLDGRSSIPNLYLGVTTSDYKVWHSGNDGSGSGLDADLLDGYQANDLMILGRSVNMLSGSTYSGYIPPLVLAMMRGAEQIENPTFLNGNNLTVYNNGHDGSVAHTRVTDATAGNGSGYVLKIHSSASAAPGGGGFTFRTSRAYCQTTCVFRAKVPAGYTINFATNDVGSGGLTGQWLTERTGTGKWEWYAYTVYFGSSPSTSHYYYLTPAANVDWYLAYAQVFYNSEALYVGMQAQKADRLTTSRTLWGKPFDGTGNVSGDMTGVGSISMSGNITTANGLFRINVTNIDADRGLDAYYSDKRLFCGFGNSGNYGIYTDATGWAMSIHGTHVAITQNSGHNVGIGTTSPAYKLDVAGTGYFSGAVSMGSTLSVSGAATLKNGLTVTGTVTASGNIIAYSSSSRLVKDILPKRTTFSQRLTALGRVVDYRYNNVLKRDKDAHIGLIYENVRDGMPGMCHTHEGYGALNYLDTDYINLVAGAVQENIDDIAYLKNKVASLEMEVERLRRGLAA